LAEIISSPRPQGAVLLYAQAVKVAYRYASPGIVAYFYRAGFAGSRSIALLAI
jgi:hypothetical protein